jgi:DNA invertase Pin-like site-specific DNA recombinase
MPQRKKNMSETEMLSWLETQYDLNENGCWVWRGVKFSTGYGQVGWKGRKTSPHRLYWLLSGRTIPEGLDMCHGPGCSKACFNPEHLRPDTKSANNGADKYRDGTANNKLTEEQVRAIREDTRLQREIADEYGVTRATISYIQRGESWSWVT